LSYQTNTKLDIYNFKGQLITTLVNKVQLAGLHSVTWNGLDNNGSTVPSGVYLYKLTTDANSHIEKMIKLK